VIDSLLTPEPAPTAVLPLATILDPWVEQSEFCERCESVQIVCFGWQTATGLLGCCLGCGEERSAPWTRENSEAV
jgi:hypothetical protein